MALRTWQPEENYDADEIFENNFEGYVESITLAFQLREYATSHLKKEDRTREKIFEFYSFHNPRRDLERRLIAFQDVGEERDGCFEELFLLFTSIPSELYLLLAQRYHLHPFEAEA